MLATQSTASPQLSGAVRLRPSHTSRALGAILPQVARNARFVRVCAASKLVLVPTGDGSTGHLGMDVTMPSSFELKEGTLELGRDVPADLIVPVPTVSSRHAILKVEGSKLSVTDLNSTNGTYISGEQLPPMQPTQVGVGDEVIFGDMFLARFRLEEVAEAGAGGEAAPLEEGSDSSQGASAAVPTPVEGGAGQA